MVARADILAGRAVILIDIQDQIEKQLRGIRSKMRMFVSGISEVGGDLFRGGLASTIAAAFPVREFTNFQDQLLFLQTKLQETDESILPLEKTIRELGKTTSFSSKEVAQAATMYAQAGFKLKEVQNSLQAALDLARGGQVDLSTSTTILSNALRTFQKDASNAANFASKFITAARLGTLDIVDLGESLKYSSGTFANFGVSIEEVLGLITTLANSGLKASLAGTSLNTAFLNMASSADKLKGLLNVDLIEDDFKNPMKALRKMEEALKRFSKVEQADILQQILNIRGGRALQGLLLQGLDQVESNIKEIQKSSDEARKSAEKLDSRLGGVGRRALSAFQELNIAIGQTTEGPLTSLGERVAAVFNDMSRLATINPKVTQTLLLMAPAALAAGVGLLALTTIMGKLAMFITPLMMLNAALFKTAGAIVGVNIKQLSSLGTFVATPYLNAKKQIDAVRAAEIKHAAAAARVAKSGTGKNAAKAILAEKKALDLLNKARQASIFTREIKLGPRLIQLLANVEAAFARVWRIISVPGAMTQTVIGSLIQLLNNLHVGRAIIGISQLTANISQLITRLQALAALRGQSLLGFLSTRPIIQFMNAVRNAMTARGFALTFQNFIVMSFQMAFSQITRLISTAGVAGFTQLVAKGLNLFGPLWRGIRAGMVAVFSVNYLQVFITGFRGLWTVARGFLTVLNGVRRILFSLSGWLLIVEGLILFGDKIPVVKDALEGLGVAFTNVFNNIKQTLKDLGPSFELIGMGINEIFSGNAGGGMMKIQRAFSDLWKTIKEGLLFAWKQFIVDIEPGAEIIRNAVKGVIGVFDALIATMGAIFGTAFEKGAIIVKADGSLLELFKSLFSAENMQTFFTMVIAFIGSIGEGLITVVDFIGNVLIEIKNVFTAILSGLADLPIFGGGAKKALDELNQPTGPNADRIKQLQADIATYERLTTGFVSWFGSPAENKKLRDRLVAARAELESLGVITPKGKSAEDIKAELKAKIDAAIAKLASMSAPTATPPEDKVAGDEARGSLAGAKIANVLMSPLKAIMTPLKGVKAKIDEDGKVTAIPTGQSRSLVESIAGAFKVGAGQMGNTFDPNDMFKWSLSHPDNKKVLDKINQETEDRDIYKELEAAGAFMSDEAFADSINNLPLTERMSADTLRNKLFGELLKNGFKPKPGEYNDMLRKKLNKGLDGLSKLTPEDVKEGLTNFLGGLKDTFLGNVPEELAAQEEQLKQARTSIGKAIVGDFESTRGNLYQMVPRMEQLQEKNNELVDEGNGELAQIKGKIGPALFNA
jgi:TP901 family phage tail tape measure protein